MLIEESMGKPTLDDSAPIEVFEVEDDEPEADLSGEEEDDEPAA